MVEGGRGGGYLLSIYYMIILHVSCPCRKLVAHAKSHLALGEALSFSEGTEKIPSSRSTPYYETTSEGGHLTACLKWPWFSVSISHVWSCERWHRLLSKLTLKFKATWPPTGSVFPGTRDIWICTKLVQSPLIYLDSSLYHIPSTCYDFLKSIMLFSHYQCYHNVHIYTTYISQFWLHVIQHQRLIHFHWGLSIYLYEAKDPGKKRSKSENNILGGNCPRLCWSLIEP